MRRITTAEREWEDMLSAGTDTGTTRRASGGRADMKPCRRCGRTDPRRMIALMTLWFGRFAGLDSAAGYFYLCPRCYDECVAPHFAPVVEKLVELHREDDPTPAPDNDAGTDAGDDV
jgi:hypothetical protein